MKLINENQCILRREDSVNIILGKNRSAKALMLRLDITCDREPSLLGKYQSMYLSLVSSLTRMNSIASLPANNNRFSFWPNPVLLTGDLPYSDPSPTVSVTVIYDRKAFSRLSIEVNASNLQVQCFKCNDARHSDNTKDT